ncbi:MAG: AAA family ATPase [Bryobacteraceae bacterium]
MQVGQTKKNTLAAANAKFDTRPLLEAALAYADRGWPVFPCRFDKAPLVEGGVLVATTDAATIEGWWRQWPSANIGFEVGGAKMMALDLDPGADKEALAKLVGPLTTKLRTTTPRGGEHLFFALSDNDPPIAPSASKIADHVDVRSFHSYVLLPPSRTKDGIYSWQEEGIPRHRSDEMVRLASIAKEKSKDRDTWVIAPDLPENIDAASAWLRDKAIAAVEGVGGDDCCYKTAAMMKSFAISEALALDLMLQHWWPRCISTNEDPAGYLTIKIENAYKHNTSPPGNCTEGYLAALTAQLFKPVAVALPSGREATAGRFRAVDREGMEHIRPPAWLVPGVLPQGAFATLFGPPGTFKSFIALDIALTVATAGWASSGIWQDVVAGPVLYSLGEGRPEMLKRVKAWELTHNFGNKITNLVLSDPVPHATEHDKLDAFIELMLGFHPDGYKLVVVDTIGRAMQGLNENAQEHASNFTRLVEVIQRELGATVLALHHSGHEAGRERGSSVFRADADTAIRVERDGKGYAVDLHMEKQKDAALWEKPKRLNLTEVTVGDAKSLVVTAGRIQPEPINATKPPANKFDPKRNDPFVMELIDGAVEKILKSNPLRTWTTRALAEAVAGEANVEVSSQTLRTNQLVTLRETKGTVSHKCYQRLSSQKVYKWAE